jgi:hypothetical protein
VQNQGNPSSVLDILMLQRYGLLKLTQPFWPPAPLEATRQPCRSRVTVASSVLALVVIRMAMDAGLMGGDLEENGSGAEAAEDDEDEDGDEDMAEPKPGKAKKGKVGTGKKTKVLDEKGKSRRMAVGGKKFCVPCGKWLPVDAFAPGSGQCGPDRRILQNLKYTAKSQGNAPWLDEQLADPHKMKRLFSAYKLKCFDAFLRMEMLNVSARRLVSDAVFGLGIFRPVDGFVLVLFGPAVLSNLFCVAVGRCAKIVGGPCPPPVYTLWVLVCPALTFYSVVLLSYRVSVIPHH